MLLDFFFSDNYTMDQLDTLRTLSSLFHEIENNTAKAMVDDEINERELGNDATSVEDDLSFTNTDSANGDVNDERDKCPGESIHVTLPKAVDESKSALK